MRWKNGRRKMIKANELRIGNEVVQGMVVGITPSEIITIDGKHWYVEEVDPIELTPNILRAQGFIHSEYDDCWSPGNDFLIKNISGMWVIIGYERKHQRIEYLHEIQNLYFALNHHELQKRKEKK